MAELKQFKDIPQGVANGDSSSFQQTFSDLHGQGEDYVREFPAQSILIALGAGFFLRLLPIGALVGLLVRLAFALARPALLIYGAVTLYKHYQKPSEEA